MNLDPPSNLNFGGNQAIRLRPTVLDREIASCNASAGGRGT